MSAIEAELLFAVGDLVNITVPHMRAEYEMIYQRGPYRIRDIVHLELLEDYKPPDGFSPYAAGLETIAGVPIHHVSCFLDSKLTRKRDDAARLNLGYLEKA